jgi:hypothetical protein
MRPLRCIRVAWVRYLAVATFAAAVAGLLASCGVAHAGRSVSGGASRRPWWSRQGVSSCAYPAAVRLRDHVMNVGGCTGVLEVPALRVTLDVGEQIDVHMLVADADPSGSRVVPVIPLPRSSRPSVVTPGAISPNRATGTYWAVHPGRAVLVSPTRECLVSRHRGFRKPTGACPVVEVTVVR